MSEPQYFVLVFGDPSPDKDRVESGIYTAGQNYPAFEVKKGDVLLLYCTGEYADYPMSIPGIGIALESTQVQIRYIWKPLPKPISREAILEEFEPEDRKKMKELGIKARRAFPVTKQSFLSLTRANESQLANVRFIGHLE